MTTERNTVTQSPLTRWLPVILAFVLGAGLAALISATTANKAAQDGASAQTTTQAAAFDVATAFPSWNKDSASLASLVAFVQDVCDPKSANYLEPEKRIATFDMDGTLICEKGPYYLDYMLLTYRVLDDPNYEADAETKQLCEQLRYYANRGTKNKDLTAGRRRAIASEFAGMTPEEFRAYVNQFLDTQKAGGFDGMTYGASFYKPMLEVIDFLRANDFEVWIVSACEREVTRAVVERLGVDPSHVIATDVAYTSTKLGDQKPYEYNMGQDEDVVLSTPLLEKCEQTNKSLAIAREIGKRPVLAFGNSSGDYGMLNYAKANGGMGLLVVADDEEREYGNAEKAKEIYQLVSEEAWTSFSMKDDWATIYGEGVVKTQLPGDVEDAETELAQAA